MRFEPLNVSELLDVFGEKANATLQRRQEAGQEARGVLVHMRDGDQARATTSDHCASLSPWTCPERPCRERGEELSVPAPLHTPPQCGLVKRETKVHMLCDAKLWAAQDSLPALGGTVQEARSAHVPPPPPPPCLGGQAGELIGAFVPHPALPRRKLATDRPRHPLSPASKRPFASTSCCGAPSMPGPPSAPSPFSAHPILYPNSEYD